MARRAFFAFHYERDVWRSSVVRNSWVTQERDAAGFWDASLWEKAKREGRESLERLINGALENTSVTAVLIGAETADREWVRYEIKQSFNRGNGLLGVYIHAIKDTLGHTDSRGTNPFTRIYTERNGKKIYLSQLHPTYDWVSDDGYNNFGNWVERAAKAAGR